MIYKETEDGLSVRILRDTRSLKTTVEKGTEKYDQLIPSDAVIEPWQTPAESKTAQIQALRDQRNEALESITVSVTIDSKPCDIWADEKSLARLKAAHEDMVNEGLASIDIPQDEAVYTLSKLQMSNVYKKGIRKEQVIRKAYAEAVKAALNV